MLQIIYAISLCVSKKEYTYFSKSFLEFSGTSFTTDDFKSQGIREH